MKDTAMSLKHILPFTMLTATIVLAAPQAFAADTPEPPAQPQQTEHEDTRAVADIRMQASDALRSSYARIDNARIAIPVSDTWQIRVSDEERRVTFPQVDSLRGSPQRSRSMIKSGDFDIYETSTRASASFRLTF